MLVRLSPGAKSKVKSSVQRAIRNKALETYPLLAPYIDEIMPKKSQLDLIKLPDRVSLYTITLSPSAPTTTASKPSSSQALPVPFTQSPRPHPLFWQHMDDPLMPHLKLIHAFPQCFTHLGIDRGAIRFVLSGAALMAPGLTSKGGYLPPPTMAPIPSQKHQLQKPSQVAEDGSGERNLSQTDQNGEKGSSGDGGDDDDGNPLSQSQPQLQESALPLPQAGDIVAIQAEGKEEVCMVGRLKMGVEEIKQVGKGAVIEGGHYLGDGLWKLNVE